MYMYLLVLNIFIEVLVAFVAPAKSACSFSSTVGSSATAIRVELEARGRGDSEFGIGVIFVRSGHEA